MNITEQDLTIKVNIITLTGRLDVTTAPRLRDHAQAKLGDGYTHFILDLSQLEFLDSAGLAALVNLLKNARTQGGDVRLVMPQAEAASRTIYLTKFDRVFSLYEDVEQAKRY